MSAPFFGKYRGSVTDIQDPQMLGRVRAKVPDVLGDKESGWAMPCAPAGGSQTGFFALPKVQAGVWIEFEGGDPDYPIWSGCWWGSQSEMPSALLSPPYKKTMLVTEGGNKLTLDDSPGAGGITLETSGGQKISILGTGIEIDNGQGAKITMQGSQVSVNSGALDIV
jgi:uncharacterized protein involved in type VI secretion and phage assembly